jgi:hypothetical protein
VSKYGSHLLCGKSLKSLNTSWSFSRSSGSGNMASTAFLLDYGAGGLSGIYIWFRMLSSGLIG